MHQKEKKYQLFSASFKDPMLIDQWYIVSCPLQFIYSGFSKLLKKVGGNVK